MSISFYSRNPNGGNLNRDDYDFDGPNFSNANARDILRYLGIEFSDEYFGEISADELIERCVTARAIGGIGQEDTGSPNISYKGKHGGIIHECGRREGYFNDAIIALEARAEQAKEKGHVIIWA